MALHLITSNRLETLAARLGDLLATAPNGALSPDVVVAQSQGMARWLKLQLARQQGVCTNIQFPFPEKFASDAFAAILGVTLDQARFSREVLTWQLMRHLPTLLGEPAFAAVRHYLRDRADTRRLFQFASRVANLLDQYLIFRPEMVRDWDTGRDDHWQAQLWRAITEDAQSDLAIPSAAPAERRSPSRRDSMEHPSAGSETGAPARMLPRVLDHPAALQQRLSELLQKPAAIADLASRFAAANLPPRIAIFGISALPPFHIQLFAALGQHLDVHLFLLQPSCEFWGDITTSREAGRVLRRAKHGAADADAFHLEEGNRLLASMGKLGRDFFGLLWDAGCWEHREDFAESGEVTLLAAIQSDILHLRNRGRDATPRAPIAADDDSLQVHSCHSPMREMEVLRDQLLDWFQRDPNLAPRDVLVMMPDIESYAPFIQAVFDAPESEAHRIPFSLADRSPRRQSHVIETFLALLDLAGSRLGAPAVLALLEAPPVRTHFGIAERDLETIRGWIEETRIRWGRDAADRAKEGLPALAQNTWRAGLDRLLLGYALVGQEREMFANILPFDEIEGESAAVLGRFAGFLERLFATLTLCEQPHTLREWSALLQRVLNDFFPDDDDRAEQELRQVRMALARLAKRQDQSGFTTPVELAVILEQLTHDLAEDAFGSGFLTGGVTFCALKPMRSIPFQIICLVGLDDGAFPRATPQLGFDLMAGKPRRGDRSMRDDDRYLFLETLLSARLRLYLSYVGQSARDNSVRPPSVLIGELLDYVEQGFTATLERSNQREEALTSGHNGERKPEDLSLLTSAATGKVSVTEQTLATDSTGHENSEAASRVLRNRLVRTHRLQAFSEDYFRAGTGLFSYSAENCRASRERLGQRTGPSAFFTEPLPEPELEWRAVDLELLVRFFRNPAKFLLERRLGLRISEGEAALDDREPFEVAGREKYWLAQNVLERVVAGESPEQIATLLRASGQLPLGRAGDAALAALQRDATNFTARLAQFLPGQPRPPLAVDLTLGDFHLTGRLDRMTAAGLLHFRCAKLKAADLLAVWIEHLAWNALHPTDASLTSAVVASDATRVFQPVAGAATHLEALLSLYWQGLRTPLKLFPETSRAFAEAEHNAATNTRATKNPLTAALTAWEGNSFPNEAGGERNDPWIALCFRDADEPFDNEFVTQARAVFIPLLQHSQEGGR